MVALLPRPVGVVDEGEEGEAGSAGGEGEGNQGARKDDQNKAHLLLFSSIDRL